jgi:hypothetical protein
MIGADGDAMKHGASQLGQIAAQELDAAVVGDAAVFVGPVKIGAAVLGDFERNTFVFTGNAYEEIVEALGPDFPSEVGEWAFVRIGIVDSGGFFARTWWDGGDKLAAVVVDT